MLSIKGNYKKGGCDYMDKNYKKYDVVTCDLGNDVIGSEQGGIRPVLIVQNDLGNTYSPCTIVIPFSSNIKKNPNQPTHSLFKKGKSKGLTKDSMLLGECIRQISKERIIEYRGTITDKRDIAEIKRVYLANFEC